MDEEALERELIEEFKDDYVGLWSVIRSIKGHYPGLSGSPLVEFTLDFLKGQMRKYDLSIGQFEGNVFKRWSTSPNETIERIRREWVDLGREPNMGDICWFTLE